MRHWRSYKYVVWVLFASVYVSCYPTGKPERIAEAETNEEKLFPNGTVVGRYSYVDKDGNPIQVKYYADEASYGVELKSLKIVDSSTNIPVDINKDFNSPKLAVPDEPNENPEFSTSILNSLDSAPKGKPKPFKYINKQNHYKGVKTSPDFEIYYQNELKGAEKCGKEKVHVYFDKERNMRNALDNFESDKYCEQF